METFDDVCIVGYALNKKKLRKGGSAVTLSQSPPPPGELLTSDSFNSNVEATAKETYSSVWKGGGLADVLSDTCNTGVLFLPVDFDQPPDAPGQPVFHVIIHKLTEDIRAQDQVVESKAKLKYLEDYLSLHPSTVLVDPVDAVQQVISRSNVCLVLQRIMDRHRGARRLPEQSESPETSESAAVVAEDNDTATCSTCPFRQPKFLLVEELGSLVPLFLASGLRFPVICKPLEACGTPNSHSMVVAVDLSGLAMVRSPSVIQEYRDHGCTFYKVYVLDRSVMVYERPSLPNLQALLRQHRRSSPSLHVHGAGEEGGVLQSILFDSRLAYPTAADFFSAPPAPPLSGSSPGRCEGGADDAYERRRKPSAADLSERSPSSHQEQFEEIAAALRDEFGLTLFGFDCIIPTSSEEEVGDSGCQCRDRRDCNIEVIDVNFFPSYKEVQDFPVRLRAYLKDRAGMSRRLTVID